MNRVVLVGNLTRDPEARTTQSGTAVTTFTIAVNRRQTNAQGVREADFIPIVTWQQTAELCARYLAKGRKVAVDGRIQTRTYDAQDGSRRYVTEVVADNVEFLTPRGQGDQPPRTDDIPLPPEPNFGHSSSSSSSYSAPAANGGFAEAGAEEQDDLPF